MSGRRGLATDMKACVTALAASGMIALSTPANAAPGISAIPPFRPSALFHPLHTSLTRVDLTEDGSIVVRVRAFSDDFSAAVSRATRTPVGADHTVSNPAAQVYVSAGLRLTVNGQPVALTLLTQRRDGDVTWLELRGSGSGTLGGALVESRLLMEFHQDQVNIVQATYGGRSHTMLFSRGEKAKRLPN